MKQTEDYANDDRDTWKQYFSIEKQTISHLLPDKVIRFKDYSSDTNYQQLISQLKTWHTTDHDWKQVGMIDDVYITSPTRVKMVDFWYTTLSKGLLSNDFDSAISVDGLGYAPAKFVKHREGFDAKTQKRRNDMLILKFYSKLQMYHTLPIGPEHLKHYSDARIRAEATPIQDCVSALMLLLCYWSNVANVKDASDMNVAWNVVFHQWIAFYHTGVDEALVRFAAFMLTDANVDVEEARRICNHNNLPDFVNALFNSTLENRQFSIDALTDIFQNNTISYMKGYTMYTKYIDDKPPVDVYTPATNTFAEKVLLLDTDGHLQVPVVDIHGNVNILTQ